MSVSAIADMFCVCGHLMRIHATGNSGKCGGAKCDCTSPVAASEGDHDPVNHPKHYTSSDATCARCGHGIECIDVVRHLGFNVGNAIKYLWRADLKGAAVEDLKKAIWYISDEIEKREAAK